MGILYVYIIRTCAKNGPRRDYTKRIFFEESMPHLLWWEVSNRAWVLGSGNPSSSCFLDLYLICTFAPKWMMAWLHKMTKRLREVCKILFKFFKNHRESFLLKLFSPMLMECSTIVEPFDNFSWYKVPVKNLSTEVCFLCDIILGQIKKGLEMVALKTSDLQENFSSMCWDPKQRMWIRMSWYFRWVLFFFCQLISHPSSLYVVVEISG